MKRSILFVAALLLSGLALALSTPPPGSVKGLAEVLAWAPQSVRNVYADAGFPFTTQGPYIQFQVRAWYNPDSGQVGLPNMPDGVEVVRIRRAGQGCAATGLCVDAGNPIDPVSEVSLDCACSTGAQCFVAASDGGVFADGGPRPMAAPLGLTLDAFKGAGCTPKPCVELWTDGGDSWPAECPIPWTDAGL